MKQRRETNLGFEAWFATAKAATRFCELHDEMTNLGYRRNILKFRPCKTGHGFIVYRRFGSNGRSLSAMEKTFD